MENFKKYRVYALAIVVALACALVTVVFLRKDDTPKQLEVKLVSKTNLGFQSVGAQGKKFQVLIDELVVSEPYRTRFIVENKTGRPILAADFAQPLELKFGEGRQVKKIDLVGVRPAGLSPELVADGGSILLSPLLLNPGDQIEVVALSSGGEPTFSIRSRIAGISEVPFVVQTEVTSPKWHKGLAFCAAVFGFSSAFSVILGLGFGRKGASVVSLGSAWIAIFSTIGLSIISIRFLVLELANGRLWVLAASVVSTLVLGAGLAIILLHDRYTKPEQRSSRNSRASDSRE